MLLSAIENLAVDYILSAHSIGAKLLEPVAQRRPAECASILIAEDEALVASNLQEQLQELSYAVYSSVKSGEEAILGCGGGNREGGRSSARQSRIRRPFTACPSYVNDLTTVNRT
jgi:hypothetical protein